MRKLFRAPLLFVPILIMMGGFAYIYVSQKGTSLENLDYNAYLPGKVFVSFYGAGIEKGKFYSGGIYEKVVDLEYVPNDTRTNQYKGTWSLGPEGVILDVGTDTEILIPVTPVMLEEGILLVDPRLSDGDGGYVIGESLDSIFRYIQLRAPQWSSIEQSVIELGPNGR